MRSIGRERRSVIGELDEASSLDLLTHARKPGDAAEQEAACRIARELGYHALALELAAVAIRRRGFVDFGLSLESPSRDALDFAAQLLAAQGTVLPHRRPSNLNLSTTLFQSIDELTPEGKDFLRLAAQMAPVPIARAIAVRALAYTQARSAEDAADKADLAIASVLALSLAREVAPENYLVHTLVSRAIRYRDEDQARHTSIRRGAVSALNDELRDDLSVRYPPSCRTERHRGARPGSALTRGRWPTTNPPRDSRSRPRCSTACTSTGSIEAFTARREK